MQSTFRHILYILFPSIFIFSLSSCHLGKTNNKEANYSSQRISMEAQGTLLLDSARILLSNGQADQAKKVIEHMRHACYLAIDCRNQGILLMDSIDIELARKELEQADSLMHLQNTPTAQDKFEEACKKVEFYERKLKHDKQVQH